MQLLTYWILCSESTVSHTYASYQWHAHTYEKKACHAYIHMLPKWFGDFTLLADGLHTASVYMSICNRLTVVLKLFNHHSIFQWKLCIQFLWKLIISVFHDPSFLNLWEWFLCNLQFSQSVFQHSLQRWVKRSRITVVSSKVWSVYTHMILQPGKLSN